MANLTVNEIIDEQESSYIPIPQLSGFYIEKFKEQLKLDGDSESTINHIVTNARNAIGNFKNPSCPIDQYFKPTKVLCIGKVQSGKTSFFLGAAALAFDNGYDIVYLLGGTKLNLKKQNFGRVFHAFENNEKVKVFDATKSFSVDLKCLVAEGYKIILVILKNSSKDVNLGMLSNLASTNKDIPSLIVDDEGDEFSPGQKAPKNGKPKKGGKTHDNILSILEVFKVCTYLSVTATPQANLLISTLDGLSPNRIVMVNPGFGYTGGREFFDSKDNKHVTIIRDVDDFVESIPDSYKEAFAFFILSCAIRMSEGDYRPYSMLVHPSSFNKVQNIVAERIKKYFDGNYLNLVQGTNSFGAIAAKDDLRAAFKKYVSINPGSNIDFEKIYAFVPEVISNIEFDILNFTSAGESEGKGRYRVKIGGNLLGRGLTIDRLIVSYIYRDSKIAMVDTMYQRCRWFGYKQSYFDTCAVYMTKELQEKFIDIVANEDDMWIRLESFLQVDKNAKHFERVFELNNDKLLLTRRTVSNTVLVAKLTSGNQADRCIGLTVEQKRHNRQLIDAYKKKHQADSFFEDFDNSPGHMQRHLMIRTTMKEFFDEYLSKAVFGFTSPFSQAYFERVLADINQNIQTPELLVMIMRDGKPEPGETRKPSIRDSSMIDELFQGYNTQTQFSGDRWPKRFPDQYDYSKEPFIQVHMIRTSDSDPYPSCFPIISYNNPVTARNICLVTGEHYYGD